MAEDKKRSWYKDKKGDKKGKSDKKDEPKKEMTMAEKHAEELKATHGRHAGARDDLQKQHEAEMAEMATRQAGEMAGPGTPGGAPAPAAMNNAGGGAAAGTPPMVAGANAA